MFKDWFDSTVALAVLVILIVAGGNALLGHAFDALRLAAAVSMLLLLPVLRKMAGRRPKRPAHHEADTADTNTHPVRTRKR